MFALVQKDSSISISDRPDTQPSDSRDFNSFLKEPSRQRRYLSRDSRIFQFLYRRLNKNLHAGTASFSICGSQWDFFPSERPPVAKDVCPVTEGYFNFYLKEAKYADTCLGIEDRLIPERQKTEDVCHGKYRYFHLWKVSKQEIDISIFERSVNKTDISIFERSVNKTDISIFGRSVNKAQIFPSLKDQ